MRDVRRTEAGFALVLALLSLLLLTFLGLTLATTTSTELQIANNYRWSEQARYNAESGLELAKRFLQQNTAWQILVPVARPTGGLTTTPSFGHTTSPDPRGIWRATSRTAIATPKRPWATASFSTSPASPTRSRTSPPTSARRSRAASRSGCAGRSTSRPTATIEDYQRDDRLVVTAEGTAPYVYSAVNTAGYASTFRKRAVRTLEVELQKVDPTECENSFQGQAGMGALGSNYDPCNPITAAGVKNAVSETTDTNR